MQKSHRDVLTVVCERLVALRFSTPALKTTSFCAVLPTARLVSKALRDVVGRAVGEAVARWVASSLQALDTFFLVYLRAGPAHPSDTPPALASTKDSRAAVLRTVKRVARGLFRAASLAFASSTRETLRRATLALMPFQLALANSAAVADDSLRRVPDPQLHELSWHSQRLVNSCWRDCPSYVVRHVVRHVAVSELGKIGLHLESLALRPNRRDERDIVPFVGGSWQLRVLDKVLEHDLRARDEARRADEARSDCRRMRAAWLGALPPPARVAMARQDATVAPCDRAAHTLLRKQQCEAWFTTLSKRRQLEIVTAGP